MLPTLNVEVEEQGFLCILKNWKIDTCERWFGEKEDLIYVEIGRKSRMALKGIVRCLFFMQKKYICLKIWRIKAVWMEFYYCLWINGHQ